MVSEMYKLTDSGNAERFAADHGDTVRYCAAWKCWLRWTGQRWQRDDRAGVEQLAKQTIRSMYAEASKADDDARRKIADHAIRSESVGRRSAMLQLAQSEPPLPIEPDRFDTDPLLLNVPNGTIELKTGTLRSHRREDFLTKICPVEFDSSATAPQWEQFLKRILDSNRGLIGFVQRLCGYCLTGSTGEQVLPIFFGAGANGKSTLVETIMAMLGPDYATKAPRELLLARRGTQHPTELATLHGRRLAVAVETEDGCRLAESSIKELTGSDMVTTRRLYENHWSFAPTHKLWLVTNHKPRVVGKDAAIWRRLLLVPFNVFVPENERDINLPEKLRAELPGILAWCVRGCLDWQQHGLQSPQAVREATMRYRAGEDEIRSFLKECCILEPSVKTPARGLLNAYHDFTGDRTMTARRLGELLNDRGCGSKTIRGYVWRTGIKLRTDEA